MTGPRINRKGLGADQGGKLRDLLQAVDAMEIGDLLRWDCPRGRFESLRARFNQTVPWKLWVHWHGERIWIVRYE